MAGRTWRDLKRGGGTSSGRENEDRRDASNSVEKAEAYSPKLTSLLEQRKTLERRFQALTSGSESQLDPREAAKFGVMTFAQRQAQQREWESKRERLQARATALQKVTRGRPGGLGRSSEGSSAQWMGQHDEKRRTKRESLRDRLSPLNDAARMGRRLHGSLSNASNQLRDLDRKLAEEGLEEDREELRKLGSDRLAKATSQVDKYTRIAEAPMGALDASDRFRQSCRTKTRGGMDKTGSYARRSKRLLSTDTGGSGDLHERMRRNRMQALKRRREQRREEARDDARRERAKRSRREEEKRE